MVVLGQSANMVIYGIAVVKAVRALCRQHGIDFPPDASDLRRSFAPASKSHNWNKPLVACWSVFDLKLALDVRTRIVAGDQKSLVEQLEKLFRAARRRAGASAGGGLMEPPATGPGVNGSYRGAGVASGRGPPRPPADGLGYPSCVVSADLVARVSREPGMQLSWATSTTEFWLLCISQHLTVRPAQAAALLVRNQRTLAHIFRTGSQGSFAPVLHFCQSVFTSAENIVALLVRGQLEADLELSLWILQLGLASGNADVAKWSCRLLAQFAKLLTKSSWPAPGELHPGIRAWLLTGSALAVAPPGAAARKDGGLGRLVTCSLRHLDLDPGRTPIMFPALEAFCAGHVCGLSSLEALLGQHIVALFPEPPHYMNFVHSLIGAMAQSQPCRAELMGEGNRLLGRLIDTAFTASAPERAAEERVVGFAFLAELWLQFEDAMDKHRVAQREAAKEAMSLLKKGVRAADLQVQVAALTSLFQLLDGFAASRNPYGPYVLKTLIFSLIESYSTNWGPVRELMVANLQMAFQRMPYLPVGVVIEPLVKQLALRGYNNVSFDLFITICLHARMQIRHGLLLLDLLANIALNDPRFSRVAGIPILILVTRFRNEPAMQMYVERVCKAGMAKLLAIARSTGGSSELAASPGNAVASRASDAADIDRDDDAAVLGATAAIREAMVLETLQKIISLKHETINPRLYAVLLAAQQRHVLRYAGRIHVGLAALLRNWGPLDPTDIVAESVPVASLGGREHDEDNQGALLFRKRGGIEGSSVPFKLRKDADPDAFSVDLGRDYERDYGRTAKFRGGESKGEVPVDDAGGKDWSANRFGRRTDQPRDLVDEIDGLVGLSDGAAGRPGPNVGAAEPGAKAGKRSRFKNKRVQDAIDAARQKRVDKLQQQLREEESKRSRDSRIKQQLRARLEKEMELKRRSEAARAESEEASKAAGRGRTENQRGGRVLGGVVEEGQNAERRYRNALKAALQLFSKHKKVFHKLFVFYAKSMTSRPVVDSMQSFADIANSNLTMSLREWNRFVLDFELVPDVITRQDSNAIFHRMHLLAASKAKSQELVESQFIGCVREVALVALCFGQFPEDQDRGNALCHYMYDVAKEHVATRPEASDFIAMTDALALGENLTGKGHAVPEVIGMRTPLRVCLEVIDVVLFRAVGVHLLYPVDVRLFRRKRPARTRPRHGRPTGKEGVAEAAEISERLYPKEKIRRKKRDLSPQVRRATDRRTIGFGGHYVSGRESDEPRTHRHRFGSAALDALPVKSRRAGEEVLRLLNRLIVAVTTGLAQKQIAVRYRVIDSVFGLDRYKLRKKAPSLSRWSHEIMQLQLPRSARPKQRFAGGSVGDGEKRKDKLEREERERIQKVKAADAARRKRQASLKAQIKADAAKKEERQAAEAAKKSEEEKIRKERERKAKEREKARREETKKKLHEWEEQQKKVAEESKRQERLAKKKEAQERALRLQKRNDEQRKKVKAFRAEQEKKEETERERKAAAELAEKKKRAREANLAVKKRSQQIDQELEEVTQMHDRELGLDGADLPLADEKSQDIDNSGPTPDTAAGAPAAPPDDSKQTTLATEGITKKK